MSFKLHNLQTFSRSFYHIINQRTFLLPVQMNGVDGTLFLNSDTNVFFSRYSVIVVACIYFFIVIPTVVVELDKLCMDEGSKIPTEHVSV